MVSTAMAYNQYKKITISINKFAVIFGKNLKKQTTGKKNYCKWKLFSVYGICAIGDWR